MSAQSSTRNPPHYSRIEVPKEPNGVESTVEPKAAKQKVNRCWATPILMLCAFFLSIIFAVSHHAYYMSLNDTLIGSTTRQQWPIRFGTAFAFLVKTSLATATGIAYIQWVWKLCHEKAVAIGAIDSAFAVDKNPFLLLSWNFMSDFPLGAVVAVGLWCIPLSALVTPATLGVAPSLHTNIHNLNVSQPSIGNADPQSNGMYSVGLFGNPSSPLTRLFGALTSTGELLSLTPPVGFPNASYTLDLIAPVVRCLPSNQNIRSWTAAAAFEASTTLKPMLNSTVVTHANNLTWTAITQTNLGNGNQNSSLTGSIGFYSMLGNTSMDPDDHTPGDLWIAIADPPNGTMIGGRNIVQYNASYFTCSLQNASIPTTITFVGNVQSLQTGQIQLRDFQPDQFTSTGVYGGLPSYQSFAKALYSHLMGSVVDVFVDVGVDYFNESGSYSQDGIWTTTIDQTVLGTAADFFAMSMAWYFESQNFASMVDVIPQAKNLTTLIEDLSLNASLSLMSISVFSNQVMTQVNETLVLNKYTYDSKNLFIAYGCSILACFVTILMGGYAIRVNGHSHDTYFSSTSNAMQNPNIAALFQQHSKDASPLKKDILKRRIRLVRHDEAERFRLEGD